MHAMQAVSSTYHQCLKSPYNGQEITIQGDPNPFSYCNTIKPKFEVIIQNNHAASPPTLQIVPTSIPSTSKVVEPKLKLKDQGMGEYSIEKTFCISQLPPSPRSYGKPSLGGKQQSLYSKRQSRDTFIRWGTLSDETDEKDIKEWLYEEEEDKLNTSESEIQIPLEQYGKGFIIMKKMGYDSHGPIGLRKQGIVEPI